MPKYEYACKSCGERIEVKQSFTDDALTECPACGGVLRKVFSSPGIVLRGPGFYRTDHRSPYRPDGTRPAEPSKDKEHAEAKSDSAKESSDSKSSSDAKGSDSGSSADSKGGSDSKASESKGVESRSSESKASGSKASESKPTRESESRSAPSRRTARDISAPGSGSSREPAGSGGSSGDTGGSKDTARTA